MKLSKSKLALAKVINENGGWKDANFSAQEKCGMVYFYFNEPNRGGLYWHGSASPVAGIEAEANSNWYRCFISREEYYQAYPKADADGWIEWNADGKSDAPIGNDVLVDVKLRCGSEHFGQLISSDSWMDLWGDESIVAYRPHKQEVELDFCESVTRSIPEPESKPTIEQLAQDYRNKLDYANRKQKEADEANAAANAALGELERAGEVLGMLIDIAKAESELVITDWRDLMIGDEVECTEYEIEYRFGVVCRIDGSSEEQPIMVDHGDGRGISWPSSWKFIRRP